MGQQNNKTIVLSGSGSTVEDAYFEVFEKKKNAEKEKARINALKALHSDDDEESEFGDTFANAFNSIPKSIICGKIFGFLHISDIMNIALVSKKVKYKFFDPMITWKSFIVNNYTYDEFFAMQETEKSDRKKNYFDICKKYYIVFERDSWTQSRVGKTFDIDKKNHNIIRKNDWKWEGAVWKYGITSNFNKKNNYIVISNRIYWEYVILQDKNVWSDANIKIGMVPENQISFFMSNSIKLGKIQGDACMLISDAENYRCYKILKKKKKLNLKRNHDDVFSNDGVFGMVFDIQDHSLTVLYNGKKLSLFSVMAQEKEPKFYPAIAVFNKGITIEVKMKNLKYLETYKEL